MNPEEAIFRRHVAEAPFQSGLDRGQWGFHESLDQMVWPVVTLWVQTDEALVPTTKTYLRFDLSGYPLSAPTSRPWDAEKNQFLPPEKWPRGEGNVSKVFNPGWNSGIALYAPCDRAAMNGHETWRSQFPGVWWEPTLTIVAYLRFIHSVLNRQQYAKADLETAA